MQRCQQAMAQGDGGRSNHSRRWSSCLMGTASALQSGKALWGKQQPPAVMAGAPLIQLCWTLREFSRRMELAASSRNQLPMLTVHHHTSLYTQLAIFSLDQTPALTLLHHQLLRRQQAPLSQRCLASLVLAHDNTCSKLFLQVLHGYGWQKA